MLGILFGNFNYLIINVGKTPQLSVVTGIVLMKCDTILYSYYSLHYCILF
jgi:hypothetical protein